MRPCAVAFCPNPAAPGSDICAECDPAAWWPWATDTTPVPHTFSPPQEVTPMRLLLVLADALQRIPERWRRAAYLALVAACAVLVAQDTLTDDEASDVLDVVARLLGIAGGVIATANVRS